MQKYFTLFFFTVALAPAANSFADDSYDKADIKRQVHDALKSGKASGIAANVVPAPPLNSDCPSVTENLLYSIPGTTAANLWRQDGHVRAPSASSANELTPDTQVITTKGGGILFAQDAKPTTVTKVTIQYNSDGSLSHLYLTHDGVRNKFAESIQYGHDAGGCTLKRVVVRAPELGKLKGVSFDEKLCSALSDKKLLKPKLAKACDDYNKQLGDTIEEFTNGLPKDETFALFTAGPDGGVKLKPYASHDFPLVNTSLAGDCLANWHGGNNSIPSPDEGGVERGSTTATPAP
ncbi:MAG: hypothetical protein ACXVCS_21700 [Bdellovibrionota bacterium]